MNPVYTMKGVGGLLEVYEDKVTITPKGLRGVIHKGVKGTKTIPFFSITAIQFKEPGLLTNGYIQFTVGGGNESKGGIFDAYSDENTFIFANNYAGNIELSIEIKDYIEKRIFESKKTQTPESSSSIADELLKLADLKSKGILSEEEFQSLKRRLIS